MPMIPVPDIKIPDDLTPSQMTYMAAQIAIQAVIHAFGQRDASETDASMSLGELADALSTALAMILATESGPKTNSDFRKKGEAYGKLIGDLAKGLHMDGDTTAQQLFAHIGITHKRTN